MITAVTCTGDRPHLFTRLERWIDRQTIRPTRWVVVDDGCEPTPCTRGQEYIRRPPGDDPRKSFANNMRAALSHVAQQPRQFVVIIEDDDWYGPDHVASLTTLLRSYELAGESHAHYYNVEHRQYRVMGNAHRASLCQTGFRSELIPRIMPLIRDDSAFLDVRLWGLDVAKVLRPTRNVVGLKGQGGRPGIGNGHRPRGYASDPDGATLRSWVGDEADEILALRADISHVTATQCNGESDAGIRRGSAIVVERDGQTLEGV